MEKLAEGSFTDARLVRTKDNAELLIQIKSSEIPENVKSTEKPQGTLVRDTYDRTYWGKEQSNFHGGDKLGKRGLEGHCVVLLLGLDGETDGMGNNCEKRAYWAWCYSAETEELTSGHVTKRNGVPDAAAAGWQENCEDVATPLAEILSSHVDHAASEAASGPGTPRKRPRAAASTEKEQDNAKRRAKLFPKLGHCLRSPEVDGQAFDEYLELTGDDGKTTEYRIQSKTAVVLANRGDDSAKCTLLRDRGLVGKQPYHATDFDFLWVHLGNHFINENFSHGFFLVPASALRDEKTNGNTLRKSFTATIPSVSKKWARDVHEYFVPYPDGTGAMAKAREILFADTNAARALVVTNSDGDVDATDVREPRASVGAKTKPERRWTGEEADALLDGIRKFGRGEWAQIRKAIWATSDFPKRSSVDLKDKWRNLEDSTTKPEGFKFRALMPALLAKTKEIIMEAADASGGTAAEEEEGEDVIVIDAD